MDTFKFQWKWFFISFSIGILVVYLMADRPIIVKKYPSPWNPSMIYKDPATDNCVSFSHEEVKCDGDEKELPV